MCANLDPIHFGCNESLQEVDENEGFNDEDKYVTGQPDSSDLYYQKILSDLFGEEMAESFLHPVMESSAARSIGTTSGKKGNMANKKPFNVSHDQTISRLTSNAERLWTMLRENSIHNLQKEDSKISNDLKMSFDAFARSCINRNLTPPQRSFVENKELNEMVNIFNKKRLEKADIGRRKKQLMFNLSRVQQGNQIILMREKSSLANSDFDVGVKELFFPPIVENRAQETFPDPGFAIKKSSVRPRYHEILAELGCDIINADALFDGAPDPPRGLRFFTAADSQAILNGKCEFADRMSAKIGTKIDSKENPVDKSRKWLDEHRARSDESFAYLLPSKSRVSLVNQSPNQCKDIKDSSKEWQPLTLGAVMNFKVTRKPTFLSDDDVHFRQGSVKWWKPKQTQT